MEGYSLHMPLAIAAEGAQVIKSMSGLWLAKRTESNAHQGPTIVSFGRGSKVGRSRNSANGAELSAVAKCSHSAPSNNLSYHAQTFAIRRHSPAKQKRCLRRKAQGAGTYNEDPIRSHQELPHIKRRDDPLRLRHDIHRAERRRQINCASCARLVF